MTSTMVRRVAGASAVAVLGAVAWIAGGPATADAAPSVSPFAGSYRGAPFGTSWVVAISRSGTIRGSWGASGQGTAGTFTGDVSDAGDIHCSGTVDYYGSYSKKLLHAPFTFHATGTLQGGPFGSGIYGTCVDSTGPLSPLKADSTFGWVRSQ